MTSDMRGFWDRRADEDAFFFVDNRLSYGDPDLERFWANGETDLNALLTTLGVAVRTQDSVLEIGCGVGRLTRVLAGRASTVAALDVSARMLDLARQHNHQLANVQWILGDGTTLAGVHDQSKDACVSHVVFQHIPDPLITLGYVREMGRVLRPGGWSAFQISNDPRIHQPDGLITRARYFARSFRRRSPGGQNDPRWLGSMVSLSDLGVAARAGGLEVARVVGEGQHMCCILLRRISPAAAL